MAAGTVTLPSPRLADAGARLAHSQNAEASDAQHSPPPSPGTSSSSFVPSYPYNVPLSYIPGNNANLTGYFSGSGVNQPMPDDSDVQTRLPSICVDYLSHDWKEDDIWTSWKAMTKHKADLANGVRLENASWRTWAKQRSKLRTISPETLNWLKDSDVTWLYGPLHTAVEPVPPARAATMEDRLNLDPQTQARHAAHPLPKSAKRLSDGSSAPTKIVQQPTKPILKYRSLSDILSVPNHRHIVDYNYEDIEELPETDMEERLSDSKAAVSHLRSESAAPRASRRGPTSVSLKTDRTASPDAAAAGPTTPSDRSASASADELEPPRKHISFNHFVEQCIAVDSDDDPGFYESASSATSDDDDEDDEDEALSFRSSPRSGNFPLLKTHSLHLDRTDKEPHTIAKLAPTVLKSSDMVYPSPSPAVVFNGQVIGSHVHFAAELDGWDNSSEQPVPSNGSVNRPGSKWEDDDDSNGSGYDYFEGNADLGVGDEYTAAHPNTARKSSLRSPTDQSPASSSGPSSPNLQAPTEGSRGGVSGRSILKSRTPGPYSGETTGHEGPPVVQPPVPPSPSQPTYADVIKGQQPAAQAPRGRSMSRGSSSSSLDRSASQDSRRSSPQVMPGDPERGRSFRRNNSSGSSLNILGSSPSSNASDVTLNARVRREVDVETNAAVAATDSLPPSSSSSSTSLTSRDDAGALLPTRESDRVPDHPSRGISSHDFALDDPHDFDKDATFLFDSPHMPSSPTSSSINLPRNNSFSMALQSVRWSDDEPSAARRALLRAQSRDSAASGVGRRSSPERHLVDDYGLNLAGFSDDEETGSIVGRAVEIVGTARDLVGALWTVAFRRSWCVALTLVGTNIQPVYRVMGVSV